LTLGSGSSAPVLVAMVAAAPPLHAQTFSWAAATDIECDGNTRTGAPITLSVAGATASDSIVWHSAGRDLSSEAGSTVGPAAWPPGEHLVTVTLRRVDGRVAVLRRSFKVASPLGGACAVDGDCLAGSCVDDTCCEQATCGSHGTCVRGTGKCSCEFGYSGVSCATCQDSFFESGDACVFCDATATCNGHGTCSPTGSCVCESPWTGAFCSEGLLSECEAGWAGADGRCFRYYATAAASQGAAATACATGQDGAHLAMPDSATLNTFTASLAQGSPAWIGVVYRSNAWQWRPTSTAIDAADDSWGPSQPTSSADGQCGAYVRSSGGNDVTWSSIGCSTAMGYVCEMEAGCPPGQYADASGICTRCPAGTYREAGNGKGAGACSLCPPGRYGATTGSTNPTCDGPC
jgi:hypothetical protein